MNASFPPWLNTTLAAIQLSDPPYTIDDLIAFQNQATESEIKLWQKKNLKPIAGEPRYGPPTQVLLVTRTAVKVQGQPQWIHASRIKAAPPLPALMTPQTAVTT
uniref:Murine leukemia virus integrase C-terminal domain-containing protein n=1 Tax=Amphiprion ocellaris TaxID=80972 RepID=A0AAQ6ADG3_AMPOC